MRVGFNPNKDKLQQPNDFFHQVIIPVYIPNNEGYFKDSLKIFEYCLESLFKTSHSKTFISIVDNGSSVEIINYLDKLYKQGNIHELIHTHNIGKLNAVLKGVSGHNFEIVTISDADVLFLDNWQEETYKVFEAFPKTGAVCPTPSSKVLKQHTYNVLFDNFFSKKLKFTLVKNPEAMLKFAESIGNTKFYKEHHLKYNLTISAGKTKAVLGAGHFVTSYKGTIFNKLNERFTNFGLGGESEEKFLDKPVADQGYWRLSTENNFAYHMGNVLEPWMQEQLSQLEGNQQKVSPPYLKKISVSKFSNLIKNKILMRVLINKRIWTWFLQFKGLSKEISRKY
ncbi:Glycosyl transferase family 2 [Flavobacterium sp. CF108]|uniref:glycosyltransferase family A protein n=1 Tax=unclassified Flavobacterium TaxID=196869 RepID=UPI0008D0DA60|nr:MULTISPECIES: glycosyltransferase family A protein [unclassified Flavobacterium]SEO49172.1 Glycosyl transferase family 2 [Flavobacterium sp. fv08]SHH71979.1 Glycosyl transferase family 2 [Flavobacterium sp. CF108]